MNSARKTLPLLVATLASFTGSTAGAVGLGELVAHSSLGESLRAEIMLVRSPGEQIDASCIKSISSAGSDDIPWIYNARIKLSGDRLIISTRDPVNHPIAMLGLRVACGNEFRRDYPILLQPPASRISSPVVEQAHSDYVVPANRETPRRSSRSAPERSYMADGAEAPPRQSARLQRPKPAPSPDKAAAAIATASPAMAPATPLPRVPEAPRKDRLVIGAGDEANLAPLHMAYQLANPPKSDEPTSPRPQVPPEQRTLAEIDDRIAAQLELDEKIKRLEEYQALLKDRVTQLDKQGRPARPAAAAAPPPAARQGHARTAQGMGRSACRPACRRRRRRRSGVDSAWPECGSAQRHRAQRAVYPVKLSGQRSARNSRRAGDAPPLHARNAAGTPAADPHAANHRQHGRMGRADLRAGSSDSL